jgi:hypothetical protein
MLQFRCAALGIQPADGNPAAVQVAQPLENFNGACFAGAIRPEQAKHFAFFHIEADAANCLDVAVTLDEVLHLNYGICHLR